MQRTRRTSAAVALHRTAPVIRRVLVRVWPVLAFLACAACVATGGAPGRY